MLKGAEIHAVIFDLDGVISFSDKYHYQAWKAVADRLGIHFDEQVNNRLRGISRMDSLNIILEGTDAIYSEQEKNMFAEEKNKIYRELLNNMTPNDVSDSVRMTLEELRRRGYRLAVGSSSRNAPIMLDRLRIRSSFDAIADGTEIVRSKPDPEVFELAAKKLGVNPIRCAVVEDAKMGIMAAKAANMTAFSLNGDARNCGEEDYNLDSIKDLLLVLPNVICQK